MTLREWTNPRGRKVKSLSHFWQPTHQAAVSRSLRTKIVARVLIVDDEQTDQTILGRIVEGAGHEVYFASGGAEALDVYMGRSIDVIVTDLHMPGIEGLELIVALQALFPDVAIIAVSGRGPELLAAAKDKGALVAFSKPVDPQELLEAIADAAPPSRSPPTGNEGTGP